MSEHDENETPSRKSHVATLLLTGAMTLPGCGPDAQKAAPELPPAPAKPQQLKNDPKPPAKFAEKAKPAGKDDRLIVCYGKIDISELEGCHTAIVHQGNFAPGELANAIRGKTKTVAGYVSATQIAGWEESKYKKLLSTKGIVLEKNKEWNSTILDITHPAWLDYIKGRLDDVVASGANAVFIDNGDDGIKQGERDSKALKQMEALLVEAKKRKLGVIISRSFDGPARDQTRLLDQWCKKDLLKGVLLESATPAQRQAAITLKRNNPQLTEYSMSYPPNMAAAQEAYRQDREDGFIPYHPQKNTLQQIEPEPAPARGR